MWMKMLFTDYQINSLDSEDKAWVYHKFRDENYFKLMFAASLVAIAHAIFFCCELIFESNVPAGEQYIATDFSLILVVSSILFLIGEHQYNKNYGVESKKTVFLQYLYELCLVICAGRFMWSDIVVRQDALGSYLALVCIIQVIPAYKFIHTVLSIAVIFIYAGILSVMYQPRNVLAMLMILSAFFIITIYHRRYIINEIVWQRKTMVLQNKLVEQSKYDFLTHAFNRQCMYEDLYRIVSESTSVGILIFDIDDFKKYNDYFSHIGGDECLVATSQEAMRRAKAAGGELYRFGGEEFVIVIPNTTYTEFEMFVSGLNQGIYGLGISHPNQGRWQFVSVSIGAGFFEHPDNNLTKLLSECDKKLYQAKANGKNCYVI